MSVTKVVILPGNGAGDVRECNWYGWMAHKLGQLFQGRGVSVELRNMPDPITARREIWLPFVKGEMGADENTLVVGHSSGAVAAMRLAEEMPLHGLVLVGACHTDLGDANERASNYYPDGPLGKNPWEFEKQVANTRFISVFASASDPFLPLEEQRHVGEQLCKKAENGAKYIEFDAEADKGHFCDSPQPELLKHIVSLVEKSLC